MSPSWFSRTFVLRDKIEGALRFRARISFELDGHSVSFPTRAARSPVDDGDRVALVVRRAFWPISGYVALAFALEGAEKARAVGRGFYVGVVLIGLPLLGTDAALAIFDNLATYASRDIGVWGLIAFAWAQLGYSAYRLIEISRGVKLLNEHLRISPASEEAGK